MGVFNVKRAGGDGHESHESREPLLGGANNNRKVLKDCGSSRFSEEDYAKQRMMMTIQSSSRLIGNLLRNSVRIVLTIGLLCLILAVGFIYGSGILLTRANILGRECHLPPSSSSSKQFKFAMVSCSDGSSRIPQRSFQGLMELVTPNKQAYVDLHGYDYIDASDCLDITRPPSWSKILAVRKHLPNYDWVFWNDADSVVTNPAIALEDIINSVVARDDDPNAEMPDFIVTEDVTGVNAGMFFFRNSEWSHRFLETWWNQTSFIKPFGQCKSGDNDALKFLVKTMDPKEKKSHVRIAPMQCMFNSNPWMPSWKNSHRLITWTWSIWQGVYSEGDFMVHLAGMGDKKTWIRKILKDLEGQQHSGGRRSGPPS